MASLKKSHASSGSSHSKAAKFKRYLPLYLMFLPGAIYLLINNYIPMAGIIVAFKKYNARLGIWKSPFCGLANFEFLFASSDAWTITRNTLLYNLAFIVLNTVVGIIFAIFICDTFNKKFKENLSECNLVSISDVGCYSWLHCICIFKSEYRYCKQFDFKCTWKRCCELVCRTEILAVHSDFCKYLEGCRIWMFDLHIYHQWH